MKRTMMTLLTLALPAVLSAQFPEAGTYKGKGGQAGSEGGFDLYLLVSGAGDSTAANLSNDGVAPIPGTSRVLPQGFEVVLPNGLRCPFINAGTNWEVVCEDVSGQPVIAVTMPMKAVPSVVPPAPDTAATGTP